MTQINRQPYRDSMAVLYCLVRQDTEGLDAVLQGIEDPAAALVAMAEMSLGVASIATNNEPTMWLDTTRDQLDALLDERERGGDHA